MIVAICLGAVVACGSAHVAAQPYSKDRHTRFRFAQTYVGLETAYLRAPFSTYVPDGEGGLQDVDLSDRLVPRLTIGGYHFWGHADFYVTFPLAGWSLDEPAEGLSGASWSSGIETGARVYPWQLDYGTVRPFAGVSWAVGGYAQTTEAGAGPEATVHHVPLQLGLTSAWAFGAFDLGVQWSPLFDLNYPVTPEKTRSLEGDALWGWFGYRYAFDATIGAEDQVREARIQETREQQRQAGARSTLSLAIGPSSAFSIRSSRLADSGATFLPGTPPGAILPDAALGYYIAPWDAALRLNYRPIFQRQSGYGASRRYARHSLSLDAFKMLFDYHGFVPFLGAGISAEWLRYAETARGGGQRRATTVKPHGSVVFGWDIRPVDTGTFLLRTNLRYTPLLGLSLDGGDRARYAHLEFNFIQLVLYPHRMALRWF